MSNKLCFLIFLTIIVQSCFTQGNDEKENEYKDFTPLESIRISYGEDSLQYGDLRMPEGDRLFPIIMIIHGGCWLSSYNLSLMDSMAVDLSKRGFATWNIEYRRTGDNGGAWPGTFNDVALGLKYLNILKEEFPIDMEHVLVTGHSAGGHLALFLGCQNKLQSQSELKVTDLPQIKGIVSLAGITDLNTYYSPSGCGSNVVNLIGGEPAELNQRYMEGSPINYLPIGTPQKLISGEKDNIVPISHITPYFEKAVSLGENIDLVPVPEANHFSVITPGSIAWPYIIESFENLLTP